MNQKAAALIRAIRSHKWTQDYKDAVTEIDRLTKPRPRARKKTWQEKGWYSPTEAFGPRSVDC